MDSSSYIKRSEEKWGYFFLWDMEKIEEQNIENFGAGKGEVKGVYPWWPLHCCDKGIKSSAEKASGEGTKMI